MALFELDELLIRIRDWRKSGATIVFTNGVFDLIHVGHVRYLAEAKALGDYLVVGVNSDDSVRRLKGPDRPLNPAFDRAEVIGAFASVDAVVLFEEDTPVSLIEKLQPDLHVKGGDYRAEDLPETKVVESYGGVVKILQFTEGRSSSSLIARMQSNEPSP